MIFFRRLNLLSEWVEDRFPLAWVRRTLAAKRVPLHKHSFWYYFGGLTLFFFGIQFVSGILLSFYYQPTPEHAYESVVEIVNGVMHGWFIRSVHAWSANILIGMLFVHMFSAFLMKAYRKPRELMWLSGVALLLIVLGFGFTGYLLPWDMKGYFATLIGTEVPKSLPLLGSWGVGLLKGGAEISEQTLTRMYSIHVIVLPLIALVVVSFHLFTSQLSPASVPVGTQTVRRTVPFFPNFVYRDLIAWALGAAALTALATMLPWGLGEKADPMASAPLGIRPEWFFLPLYQTLRFFPSHLFGVDGELVVNLIVGGLMLFWALVPFVDRRSSRQERSPVFTAIGLLLIAYLVTTIIVAYMT